MGLAHSAQINRIKKGKSDELALSHKKLDHICRRMYIPNTKKWLFSNNYISSVHPRVSFLKFLSTVDLSANELTAFPVELCSIPLRVLNLSFNKITWLPVEINKLVTLSELRLSFNSIYELPQAIFDARMCIERLELNNNFLEQLPSTIKNLTLLKHLNLQNNNFSSFPTVLVIFANLEELNLSHNKLLDLSPSVGGCVTLRTLQLHNNLLTIFPPSDIQEPYLPSLTHLRLNNNRIHTILPAISHLTTLHVLNVRNNELHTLPSEIALLTNLSRLNLSLNRKLIFNDLSFVAVCPVAPARAGNRSYPPPRDDKGKTPRGGNKGKSPRGNSPRSHTPTENGSIHDSTTDSNGSQKSTEVIVSQTMVPTYEQAKAAGSDIYAALKVVEETPTIDTGLLDQHVDLLLQQGVWSGGYDFQSVEDEVRNTLVSITRIRDGLFLSSKYGAQDREALHSRGITHILVVASELSPFFPDEFDYCVINVRDNAFTSDLAMHFPTCQKFIDIGRKKGGVLVHCSAGVSRSATVIMSYLMWSEMMSFAQARKEITALRPIVKSNFYVQLQGYSDFLKAYRKKVEKRKRKNTAPPTPRQLLKATSMSSFETLQQPSEEEMARTQSLTVSVYL